MKGARRPIDDEELARDIKVHSFGCKGKVVINNCTTTSEQRTPPLWHQLAGTALLSFRKAIFSK